MGYTHYWRRPANLDAKRFAAFVEDVRALLAHLPQNTSTAGGFYADEPLVVRGPLGHGQPVVTPERVDFNGDGEGGCDMEHESFDVARELDPEHENEAPVEDFCKTARKPYDLLVTACLIALKHHFREVAVWSDGDSADWAAGRELYERVLRPAAESGPWLTQAELHRGHEAPAGRAA